VQTLINQLAKQHILVIGDIILDEYLTGKATRMSREAPIPVLEYESRRLIPGGAANPAANITALGSTAYQLAVAGTDDFAAQLTETLIERGIQTDTIIADPGRPTTVKTRIMAQMGLRFPQQVARLDRLSRKPISSEIEAQFLAAIDAIPHHIDAVLFSDYHAGVLTPTLVNAIREKMTDAVIAADAQGELDKYRGCTLLKCNADEARTYLQMEINTDAEFSAAARTLFDTLALTGGMVITRGADGATLATVEAVIHCPAPSIIDVYDTVGAGDTAIAVMTMGIVTGASYADAVTLANYASGLVVRRVGNYTPSPDELSRAVAMWS